MRIESHTFLPVEIVFHPSWWHAEAGIRFDRAHYYDPGRRVADELAMRRELRRRFGPAAEDDSEPRPEPILGPVHLAAGYLFSALWGCRVEYPEDASPQVIPAGKTLAEVDALEPPDPAVHPEFRAFLDLAAALREQFGYVRGDVNWTGVQNLALDLIGQDLFLAYYDDPERVHRVLRKLALHYVDILRAIRAETGTTSLTVNRSVGKVDPAITLHSNCSVQMVSNDLYETFLLPHDQFLARELPPYGIHHCGDNMHKVAPGYAKVPDACFFDVGWGADLAECRRWLPDAFFNIRLSPVRVAAGTPDDVERDLAGLLESAGDLSNIGVCCINMAAGTPDENVRRIFEVVERYRGFGG